MQYLKKKQGYINWDYIAFELNLNENHVKKVS